MPFPSIRSGTFNNFFVLFKAASSKNLSKQRNVLLPAVLQYSFAELVFCMFTGKHLTRCTQREPTSSSMNDFHYQEPSALNRTIITSQRELHKINIMHQSSSTKFMTTLFSFYFFFICLLICLATA